MKDKNKKLEKKANLIRKLSLKQCISGGGHLASALSCVDILVALYYGDILSFDLANHKWIGRDRFILSKGHAATALYAVLADIGFLSKNDLNNYCKEGSILGSHPDLIIPAVEATTGSLGHGLGLGCGMAIAAKMDCRNHSIVVLLGDGECSEGAVWESILFANKHKLGNLLAVVDRNNLCVTDFTENCIGLDPFKEKWESFGWNVFEVYGHSFCELLRVFNIFKEQKSDKPTVVIANTIKGKGISFMENDPIWHTKVPSGKLIDEAKRYLYWGNDEDI